MKKGKPTHSLRKNKLLLIKKCHKCGYVMETNIEPKKCAKCLKSFLPLKYFSKIHAKNCKEFQKLFCESHDLQEEDLIKGINALW